MYISSTLLTERFARFTLLWCFDSFGSFCLIQSVKSLANFKIVFYESEEHMHADDNLVRFEKKVFFEN